MKVNVQKDIFNLKVVVWFMLSLFSNFRALISSLYLNSYKFLMGYLLLTGRSVNGTSGVFRSPPPFLS